MRVLVVDDRLQMRVLVRALVEHMGHAVVGEAVTGAHAVEQAAELRPDLVVMDWDMPVMKGLEACALITAELPGVQVIAFSSARNPLLRELFLRSGARELVGKADVAGLIAQVEACAAS